MAKETLSKFTQCVPIWASVQIWYAPSLPEFNPIPKQGTFAPFNFFVILSFFARHYSKCKIVSAYSYFIMNRYADRSRIIRQLVSEYAKSILAHMDNTIHANRHKLEPICRSFGALAILLVCDFALEADLCNLLPFVYK